jgi:hypothetical protein
MNRLYRRLKEALGRRDRVALAELLVEAGANVNAVEHDPEDDCRNTALDCCTRHPDIETFLRSVGAKRFHELEDIL